MPWRTLLAVLLPIVVIALAVEVVATIVESRSPPQRMRKLLAQAALHRQIKQFDEAARVLEEAAGLGIEDASVSVLLAQVRLAQGRRADAKLVLQLAHARRPRDPTLTVPLAHLLLEEGRALEAAELLEPAYESIRKITDPVDRVGALILAGRAAVGKGALLQAEALLREATKVGPAPVTQVAKAAAEAWLALADLYKRSGRLPHAQQAVDAARTLTPWDPRITLETARLLELVGRSSDAIAQLEPLVAKAEPDLQAIAALGDLLIRVDRHHEVAALASQAASAPAGRELAGALRAAAALASGDRERASSEANEFVRDHPSSPVAHLAQGRQALLWNDLVAARAAFEAALARNPDLTEAATNLLEVYERSGDLAAVRACALDLLGRRDARPRAMRALLMHAARDPTTVAAAVARLQELLAQQSGDPRLRAYLGLMSVLSGDIERASVELQPLLGAPDLSSATSTLAETPEATLEVMAAFEIAAALALRDAAAYPAARVLLARALERLDRVALADAVVRDQDAPEVGPLLVQLAVRAGDTDRAIARLEDLIAKSSEDAGLLGALGELRLSRGQALQALVPLDRAARAAPTSSLLRARLARARAAAGDLEGARADFKAARELDARLPFGHEDALLLLLSDDLQGASAALRVALTTTGDPRFGLALAATEAACGRPREARAAFEGLTGAGAPLLFAALLASVDDLDRARAEVRRAPAPEVVRIAAIARGDPAARRDLWKLIALSALGWEPEARTLAAKLADDPRADAMALYLAWQATSAGPDAALAARLGERLNRVAPDDAEVMLRLAAARRAIGDLGGEAAILSALRGRERQGRDDASVLTELGAAFTRAGDLPGAEASYRAALARAPGQAAAHNNLAFLLAAGPTAERRSEGLVHAREAVRLAPFAWEALDTLGWLLHLEGDHRAAIKLLERAAAGLPNNGTVRFHAAAALAALGRRESARLTLEIALRLPAGWPEEAQARALLHELQR